jgi:glutaredoxin
MLEKLGLSAGRFRWIIPYFLAAAVAIPIGMAARTALEAHRSRIQYGDYQHLFAIDKPQLILYRSVACEYCKEASFYLSQHGISVQERTLNNSAEYRREFEEIGGKAVPMLLAPNALVVGFYPRDYQELATRSAPAK